MSSLISALNVSASALDVQRARMEVAVSNLANADTTRTTEGQPYRRHEVVLEAVPADLPSWVPGAGQAGGVRVAGIVEDQSPLDTKYDPTSPDADENGNVLMPNVSVPEEMVDMLGAARAYQANLTAIGLIRDTIQRALDLAK